MEEVTLVEECSIIRYPKGRLRPFDIQDCGSSFQYDKMEERGPILHISMKPECMMTSLSLWRRMILSYALGMESRVDETSTEPSLRSQTQTNPSADH